MAIKLDENIINYCISIEGLDILVVSYGGSCSNVLADTLEKNNYKCKTRIWCQMLCHCPVFININIPIIYIYDNPIKAFMSMRNRGHGFWDANQKKLSNNNNCQLSDEHLLKCMINQFNNFINKNVLIIKSCEIFQNNIVNKLEFFLNKKLYHFPILYITPKTTSKIEDKSLIELFKKYKTDIDCINKIEPSLMNKLQDKNGI